MKIAVTSKDGAKVNQHFGKANSFLIYELTDKYISYIEKREVDSYCQNTNGIAVDPNHKFSVDRFALVYEKIKDCQVLYTQQIGDIPLEKLKELGIGVKLCNCKIESIAGCSGDCKD